jgi:hypothetical protein
MPFEQQAVLELFSCLGPTPFILSSSSACPTATCHQVGWCAWPGKQVWRAHMELVLSVGTWHHFPPSYVLPILRILKGQALPLPTLFSVS